MIIVICIAFLHSIRIRSNYYLEKLQTFKLMYKQAKLRLTRGTKGQRKIQAANCRIVAIINLHPPWYMLMQSEATLIGALLARNSFCVAQSSSESSLDFASRSSISLPNAASLPSTSSGAGDFVLLSHDCASSRAF